MPALPNLRSSWTAPVLLSSLPSKTPTRNAALRLSGIWNAFLGRFATRIMSTVHGSLLLYPFPLHELGQDQQAVAHQVWTGMAVGLSAPKACKLSHQEIGLPQTHRGCAGGLGQRRCPSRDHRAAGPNWLRGLRAHSSPVVDAAKALPGNKRLRAFGTRCWSRGAQGSFF
jgi:hypothetical protein